MTLFFVAVMTSTAWVDSSCTGANLVGSNPTAVTFAQAEQSHHALDHASGNKVGWQHIFPWGEGVLKKLGLFALSCRWRPYRVESTRSLPSSEVKQPRVIARGPGFNSQNSPLDAFMEVCDEGRSLDGCQI